MALRSKAVSVTASEPPYGRLRYLKTTDTWHSWYPLLGLDRAMEDAGLTGIKDHQRTQTRRVARAISRLHLNRNLRRSADGPIFVAMMGYSEGRTLPFAYWNELVPYAFDCWPKMYRRWTAFFQRHRIRLAFFSARGSAEYFARELPAMRSVWLPEAVDPAEYRSSLPLVDRGIDVLELGRKYDRFHDAIAPTLATAGRSHLFERRPGERIFATRLALSEGLGSSRISVCFPRSVTHAEHTGGLETVTHRYFESMASGCILLGRCPDELKDLFGYNPVIEVQDGDESRQIERILADVAAFQPHVDANLQRLFEVGTWDHRVRQVLHHVEEAGLVAPKP